MAKCLHCEKKIIRQPFGQLYSVHAFIQKDDCMKQVPLMFVMMSRRRKRDYVAVFQKIWELLPDVSVEDFVMDFERAMWTAFQDVFPGAHIHGCSFHWGQAVMRKVANLGLKTTYEERQGVHRLIKKILALPYLPPGHIPGAFTNLRQLANTPALRDLFQYVEETWLESDVWSVCQWSVFRRCIRSSNDVEGWHRRMIGKAGKAKLQFYVLVPQLRREADQLSIVVRLVDEQQLSRYQRTTYRRLQGTLFNLWDEYEERTINTSLFLRKVGALFAPAVQHLEENQDQ